MTLNDLVNMIHTPDLDLTVYVFTDEDERDGYRYQQQPDGYIFAVKTPYRLHVVLCEKYANAKVEAICPVSANEIDIIVRLEGVADA